MDDLWPLSRSLLMAILADKITDRFVAKLVWDRLGYKRLDEKLDIFKCTASTPVYWSQKFPEAPEIISKRIASVHLTRSIPKEHKQSLKTVLNFQGYKIDELFPRKTRRATAVNWLLAWTIINKEMLSDLGPMPVHSEPSPDPRKGHFGDPEIE